jgi:hypothetical protein
VVTTPLELLRLHTCLLLKRGRANHGRIGPLLEGRECHRCGIDADLNLGVLATDLIHVRLEKMLAIRSPGVRACDAEKIRLEVSHVSVRATDLIAPYEAENMPTLLHMPNILRQLIISLRILHSLV